MLVLNLSFCPLISHQFSLQMPYNYKFESSSYLLSIFSHLMVFSRNSSLPNSCLLNFFKLSPYFFIPSQESSVINDSFSTFTFIPFSLKYLSHSLTNVVFSVPHAPSIIIIDVSTCCPFIKVSLKDGITFLFINIVLISLSSQSDISQDSVCSGIFVVIALKQCTILHSFS